MPCVWRHMHAMVSLIRSTFLRACIYNIMIAIAIIAVIVGVIWYATSTSTTKEGRTTCAPGVYNTRYAPGAGEKTTVGVPLDACKSMCQNDPSCVQYVHWRGTATSQPACYTYTKHGNLMNQQYGNDPGFVSGNCG